MSGVVAAPGQQTHCIQTYFCDPEYQDRHRTDLLKPNRPADDRGRQKDLQVFQLLREVLTNVHDDCDNRYIASFKQAIQHLRDSNIPLDDIKISLKETPSVMAGEHSGQFHLPRCPEMAILYPQQVHENSFRQIICKARATSLNDGRPRCCFFDDTHQSYNPIMYPVLFPHGTNGHHKELRSISVKNGQCHKISLSAYMRYILMERSTHYNYILRARKLFQQFVVDMWAIDETESLKWVKNNQKELRASSYHAVKQAVIANKVEASGAMVVPASFTGGQRWYDRYYQNAMALVRHFDKPTFFITMTLDVNCPEVQQHMIPGMTPYDRADILCRVFQLKKKNLLI